MPERVRGYYHQSMAFVAMKIERILYKIIINKGVNRFFMTSEVEFELLLLIAK